jgi:AraC-like DNA-binding protein
MKIRRFDSHACPPTGRLEQFNAFLATAVPGMVVDSAQPIEASLRRLQLGDVSISAALSQAATARFQAGRRPDQTNHVGIIIQSAGLATVLHRNRSVVLKPGDIMLVAGNEDLEIQVKDGARHYGLGFPAGELGLGEPDADGVIGTVIAGSRPFAGLLHDHVGSLMRQQWSETPAAEEIEALRSVLLRLTRSCVEANIRNPSSRLQTDANRVFHFVDKRLFDPGLSTATIAKHLSLARRTVQHVFARAGTTPTAYILDQRLTAAANILRGGQGFGSIRTLARDLGFSDASYFTRCFKARFGLSPLRYKKENF